MSTKILDQMKKANNIQIGTCLIMLHEADTQLLPVLQSAIEQCGFSGSLNNMLWIKELPNQKKTALVIYCYKDNSLVPLHKIANTGRSVVILTNGEDNRKNPILIDTVYKNTVSTSQTNAIHFNVPIETFGAVAECELMFENEQRTESDLSQRQVNAIEAVQQASQYLRMKYFVMASTSHQHQLALFLDNSTPHFPMSNEKRISLVRFRKDTPANVPCLTETLKRVGVETVILFKATNDRWICYYIFVDNLLQLLAMTKFGEVFQPLFPWMVAIDGPCWRFTETLLNHPNNTYIKEEIRCVMMLLHNFPYLGGNPERCSRHAIIHKVLMGDAASTEQCFLTLRNYIAAPSRYQE